MNDALQGTLWRDDSLIVISLLTKTYTQEKQGCTVVYAEEIPDEPFNYDKLFPVIRQHAELP